LRIEVTDDADQGASAHLARFLRGEHEFRGQVAVIPAVSPPDAMGAVTDSLVVVLSQTGIATALSATLIAWIRSRRGSTRLTVTRPDGSTVTVVATQVKSLTSAELHAFAAEFAVMLDSGAPGKPGQDDDAQQ
jgi:Effector Associated Constant Component 1